MPRGSEDFSQFLEEYGKLAVAAVGIGTVPFVTALTSLAPPWPTGLASITAIAQLAVLLIVYQFLINKPKRTVDRVIILSFVATFLLSLIYIGLLLGFTYQLPQEPARYARGFVCTPIAAAQYAEKCPFLGVDELNQVEYRADRLWTDNSLNAVHMSLFVAWMAPFMALTTLVGSFSSTKGAFPNVAREELIDRSNPLAAG